MARALVAWSGTAALFVALYVGVPSAGLALDRSLGWPALPASVVAPGVALLVIGAVGLAWCIALFVKVGEGTPNPVRPPRRLVTTGPFAWTRNPIIGSHLLALLGADLLVRSPAAILIVVALVPPVATLVRREESGLEARFGDAFRRYAASVPRWIPRRPRHQRR